MTRPRWLPGVVLGSTVLLLVVAAVWAWTLIQEERATSAPDASLADQCDRVPADAERVTLEADDGFTLGAATVGPAGAKTGLVIRQGAGQTLCDWLPLAGRIAEEKNVRVLLFDRRGQGSSPGEGDLTAEPGDLATAVAWLDSHGASSVGVMASSMGNSVMFASLPDLDPAPCVVISVSPVLVSSDSHGEVDGTELVDLPDNVWVATETQNTLVAAAASDIAAAADTDHVLRVDTKAHSIGLVNRFPQVADFVVEAAGSCR